MGSILTQGRPPGRSSCLHRSSFRVTHHAVIQWAHRALSLSLGVSDWVPPLTPYPTHTNTTQMVLVSEVPQTDFVLSSTQKSSSSVRPSLIYGHRNCETSDPRNAGVFLENFLRWKCPTMEKWPRDHVRYRPPQTLRSSYFLPSLRNIKTNAICRAFIKRFVVGMTRRDPRLHQ